MGEVAGLLELPGLSKGVRDGCHIGAFTRRAPREVSEESGIVLAILSILPFSAPHFRRGMTTANVHDRINFMATSTTITEAEILEKVVAPGEGEMDPDAARAILDLKFDSATTRLVSRLLQRNNRGTITAQDRITLEKYLRVRKFIDLLHAKALLSLRHQNQHAE